MELEIFVCDAFTNQKFSGNSAAVILVADWLSDELMQNIAAENNLSETAFVKQLGHDEYQIRWFSPLTEVDFCGHATLAAAFVLFKHFDASQQITFDTASVGVLTVEQTPDSRIHMSFPNRKPEHVAQPPVELLEGLSIAPVKVLKSSQAYFAIYENEQQVKSIQTNSEQLKKLAPYDVVVSAPSETGFDFVSRYFWPANGGDEDPVTGSIHAGLAPYWGEQLNKSNLKAFQASKRGGVLYCHLLEERVLISGDAVLYSHGKIFI
ncbi:PhzF family phenazine biosynthesis protein [Vibrio sp. TRT 21S02]|uniref:PhzF family phenazine biosynthesis protein n=1 Tax=Vibrio sp. TRT 21S02 TaxID=3418507 RepID=UPI003CEF916E